MTLEFYCPKCGSIIAFPDKFAGRRARCLTCKQRFIIPNQSWQRPCNVAEPRPSAEPEPVKGFYKAALLDGWVLPFLPENLAGLVMALLATAGIFFCGPWEVPIVVGPLVVVFLPVGRIIQILCWGLLFWYYLEVILGATFEGQVLADLHLGEDLWERLFHIVKGLWIFGFGLFLAQLPYALWVWFCRILLIGPGLVGTSLNILGLVLFPMVVLNFAINRDITLLVRFDLMIRPILRAPVPYLVAAGLMISTWQLYLYTKDYEQLRSAGNLSIGIWLSARLAHQFLAIISIRAIGLFYRHFSCYFGW